MTGVQTCALPIYVGQDLITTDGTTLLGADDKAGIAEIMALAQYLLEHPEIPHGTVKIGSIGLSLCSSINSENVKFENLKKIIRIVKMKRGYWQFLANRDGPLTRIY